MTYIDDIHIGKTPVEVHAHTTGMWEIRTKQQDHDGDRLAYGPNLANLKGQAKRELRKQVKRVSVPFITRDGRQAIARGFHAGSTSYYPKKVLVWIDDGTEKGRNETWGSYQTRGRALSPNTTTEDLEKYLRLLKQRERAAEIVKKWEQKFKYDLVQAVSDELNRMYPPEQQEQQEQAEQ